MTTIKTHLLSAMVLSMGLSLVACGGKTPKIKDINCSNETGLSTLKNIIIQDAQRELKASNIPADTVTATLNKLNLSFSDFRTNSGDASGNKVSCEASLNLTLPTNLYNDINEAVKASGDYDDIDALLANYHYRPSAQANVFYTNISYNLQPTDDGKQIFARFNDDVNNTGVGTLVGLALSKPVVQSDQDEAEDFDEAMDDTEETQDTEGLDETETETEETPEETPKKIHPNHSPTDKPANDRQLQAQLARAQREHKAIIATINNTWKKLEQNLPAGLKAKLTEEQKAFNEERQADCEAVSAEVEGNDIQQEIAYYRCSTDKLRQRNKEFESYL